MKNHKNSSVSVNIFSNWGILVVRIAISFMMMPFLINHIGKHEYGLWALIMSIAMYISMLDVGIYSSVRRYVPMYEGKKDFESINKTLSSCMRIYIFIGLIALIISIIVSFMSSYIFSLTGSDADEFKITLLIVSIAVSMRFPLGLAGGVISAFQRFDIDNNIQMTFEIVKMVAVMILISFGFGIITIGVIYASEMIISCIIKWYFLIKIWPEIEIKSYFADKEYYKKIFNYSSMSFLIVIAEVIHNEIDIIFIGIFLTPVHLTIYSVAKTFFLYANNIVGGISRPLTPAFSKHEGAEEYEEMKNLYINSLKIYFAIGGIIAAGMVTMSDVFIGLWLGEGYDTTVKCITVLSIFFLIVAARGGSRPLLFGISKHKYIVKLHIIETITSIALILILIKPFGLLGVVISMGIGKSIMSIGSTILACRYLRISILEYFRSCLKIIIMFFIFVIFSEIIISRIQIDSYFYFIVTVLCQLVSYFCFLYVFSLNDNEKNFINNKSKKIFNNILGFRKTHTDF